MEAHVREIQLKDAKATFSAVIDQSVHGIRWESIEYLYAQKLLPLDLRCVQLLVGLLMTLAPEFGRHCDSRHG
jgi:hypothetical protein